MYYFDIKEVLSKAENKLSAEDIFLELSINKRVSMYRIRKILTKMYLKNQIERSTVQGFSKGKKYVYFLKIEKCI